MGDGRFAAYPIAGALGAEVVGIDLSAPLGDATVARIRCALLGHQVIFFRDQHLTPEQHLGFGRRFGELGDRRRNHRLRPQTPIKREGFEIVLKQPFRPVDEGGLGWSSADCVGRAPGTLLLIGLSSTSASRGKAVSIR
jgi:alpha-ketoglutarate-dependent taurine dioxygenase